MSPPRAERVGCAGDATAVATLPLGRIAPIARDDASGACTVPASPDGATTARTAAVMRAWIGARFTPGIVVGTADGVNAKHRMCHLQPGFPCIHCITCPVCARVIPSAATPYAASEGRHLPRTTRRRVATLLIGTTLITGLVAPVGLVGEPAPVRARKADVRRLQAQLDAIGQRVEAAAERYNGARWKLDVIRTRLRKNQRVLTHAIDDLHTSQRILGDRVQALYRRPEPSLVEVLVSSGSLTAAVNGIDAIERAGDQDAQIVGRMRVFRNRTIRVRLALTKDRAAAKVEVTNAAQERVRVEAILAERQRVLENARADLRQAIADEAAQQRAAALAAAGAQRSAAASGYKAFSGPLPSGEGNGQAARIALQFQGVPYVWGGASPSGFDCSGLAAYAYAKIGKSVPHYTYAIWSAFPQVPFDQLQPGDLVFFSGLGHMGIYIGDGNMVHAPHTGDVVRVAAMADRMGGYVGAVRP